MPLQRGSYLSHLEQPPIEQGGGLTRHLDSCAGTAPPTCR
jgi:hypothetical protein